MMEIWRAKTCYKNRCEINTTDMLIKLCVFICVQTSQNLSSNGQMAKRFNLKPLKHKLSDSDKKNMKKHLLIPIIPKHHEMRWKRIHFWIALHASQNYQNESRELPEFKSCQNESRELPNWARRAINMSHENCQNEPRELPEWITKTAKLSHENFKHRWLYIHLNNMNVNNAFATFTDCFNVFFCFFFCFVYNA